ncbi:MAG TPA: anti-sigma factor [Gemmatimonadaceae bacterium]|nr:anti-sigma factor [Gemmatimonadaceae bacterium]
MQRLWEYLDDELPGAESRRMRHHLAECSRCAPHVAFERRLLDRIAAIRPSCGDAPAVRRRIIGTLALRGLLPDWKDR